MDSVVERLLPTIKDLAHQTLVQYRLPGIALGIIRDQELVCFCGFGAADLDTGRQPDTQTIARVASVTKTFTTTALMQLRDEGKLDLADPLVKHLPEFSQVKAQAGPIEAVTLRRLLTHRAGLVTESPGPSWDTLDFPTQAMVLANLPETEIVIAPDSAWKYSNLAFGLLGQVIERVSGQLYTDYIHTHILTPLGLTSTVFDLTTEQKARCFVGYNPAPYQDYPERAPYAHLRGLTAAGQLHSTVSDLAKWVSFQFQTAGGQRGGAQVLSGQTLAEIQRPHYLEPDWSAGQCLGWRATRIGNHVYHNHGGGIHGFSTQVWFNVPAKTGAVQFINMWPPPGGQGLIQSVLEMILETDEAAAKPSTQPHLEPAPAPFQRFLGIYRAQPGISVQIEWRQGQLRLVELPGSAYSLHAPAILKPTEREDIWRVVGGRAAGERAVISFTTDGRVISYELGGFVFKKYSAT